MLVLRHIGIERGTAVLDTLPRSGERLQSIPGAGGMGGARALVSSAGMTPQPPDPAQVAAAVARHRACQALREFRARLYGCLTSRPDALFELCDAILCADQAVTSLAELSMVPEFRRGHGALYDALPAGRVDQEALAALLAGARGGGRTSMWSAPPRPGARIRRPGRSRTCCAACTRRAEPAGAAPRWSSWTPATAPPR